MSNELNQKYEGEVDLNEAQLFTYDQVYFLTNVKVPSLSALVRNNTILELRDYVRINTMVRFKREFVLRLLNEGIKSNAS